MLERKGIEHRVVQLLPGMHPLQLRLHGFRGGTVPALRIDGRRVQNSRRISRALDEMVPDLPLFPAEPDARHAVEDAERWGEEVFQDTPRRLFRWGSVHSGRLRRWIADDVVGMPAPGVMERAFVPLAHYFARKSAADDAGVREELAALPGRLDRVDGLISEEVIGGEAPNAADVQILSTVRVLLGFTDLREAIEARPAAAAARRLFPAYPEPVPSVLPPEWVKPLFR
jgi:glutathione S-transferase